jgi:hypothetical protein
VFSSFRIYATAMNLLTLTNYKGYDPEVSASVNDAKSLFSQKGWIRASIRSRGHSFWDSGWVLNSFDSFSFS